MPQTGRPSPQPAHALLATPRRMLLPAVLVAAGAYACTLYPSGEAGPGAYSSTPPGAQEPMDPALQAAHDQMVASTPVVRNLSNTEYLNATSDLLGVRVPVELQKSWTATTQYSGFDAVPWSNMDAKAVRDRTETLESILDLAVKSPKVMTCTVADAAALPYPGCAKSIVETFATRAFGRPLVAAEAQALGKSYDDGVALAQSVLTVPTEIFTDGVRAALGSVLFAPQFLNRMETAPTPGFVGERDLDAYEVASRLSFMMLGSLPDDELWASAQDGTLTSQPGVLRAQVTRLLDTKTDVFVQSFMGQWFDFRAYEHADPASLEAALFNESWRTLADIVKADLPLSAILVPGFTYANDRVAAHYGLGAQLTTAFEKVPTPERGGVLQQGSWLTLSATSLGTKAMHRGRMVQDRFLCKSIPPPDSALFEKIQAASAAVPKDASVKERLRMHREAGEACFGCHQYMDPIGLGLESFDEVGKVRATYADTQKPVETDSDILGTPFATANEMIAILSKMPEFRQCASEKLSMYALKRVIFAGGKEDAALLAYLGLEIGGKPVGVREMIFRLVNSKAFLKVNHGARP